MSLRDQAAADLQTILEDAEGFSWPIKLTSPDGVTVDVTGFSSDIGQELDLETQMIAAGRTASVAIPIRRLNELHVGIPRGIADGAIKPWVVRFEDAMGTEHTFKIQHAMPDYAVGCITCTLEAYEA